MKFLQIAQKAYIFHRFSGRASASMSGSMSESKRAYFMRSARPLLSPLPLTGCTPVARAQEAWSGVRPWAFVLAHEHDKVQFYKFDEETTKAPLPDLLTDSITSIEIPQPKAESSEGIS